MLPSGFIGDVARHGYGARLVPSEGTK
jgi:hypothetical protein